MHKKHLLIPLALFLAGCQTQDIDVQPPVQESSSHSVRSHRIPVEDALRNLENFLSDSDSPKTRAASRILPSSVLSVTSNAGNGLTRSEKSDTILYVANFGDDSGYAIISADDRISEDVLAVTDQGEINDNIIKTAIELSQEERTFFDGYPMDGPGLFTTEETGDEVFLNPNTISLYNDSILDTMVGTFCDDDDRAMDLNGELLPTSAISDEEVSPVEVLMTSLCYKYANNDIITFDSGKGNFDLTDSEAGMASDIPNVYFESDTLYSEIKNVEPLFTNYYHWKQNGKNEIFKNYYPFNDYYPFRRKYIFFGRKKPAPAGCFPLAIAKIITYFNLKDKLRERYGEINLEELGRGVYSYNTEVGRKSAASLLLEISEGCKSLYFYAGTFTFPSNGTSYMRKIGIKNSHTRTYSSDRVRSMLDNGSPLIVMAVPGIKINSSHAWNIDGYKIKKRTITTKIFRGSQLDSIKESSDSTLMVHCDFGWGGSANGYYVSGIFNSKSKNTELDWGGSTGGKFNNFIHVVTYDKIDK